MDISKLADAVAQDENPATVIIYGKDGQPYTNGDGHTAFAMDIVGSEARAYKEAKNAITRGTIASKRTRITDSDVNTNRVSLAAACVVGWNQLDSVGKPVPCNRANVEAMLRTADHVLEQVEQARDAHASFFTPSSPQQ